MEEFPELCHGHVLRMAMSCVLNFHDTPTTRIDDAVGYLDGYDEWRNNEPRFVPKNDITSYKYRKLGNERFADNYLARAAHTYNQSICHAENDSECLAFGYANRSAVYFRCGEWKSCLESIRLSQECANFPEKLIEKLAKREKACRDEMRQNPPSEVNTTVNPNLSYPPREFTPYISQCIEYRQGRIIAARDLNVGDVISIEKPFLMAPDDDGSFKRCHYCMSINFYQLIPCKRCTRVMFCNEDCRAKADERFHKIECSAIDGLLTMIPTRYFMALRPVLQLFSDTALVNRFKHALRNHPITNLFGIKDLSYFEQLRAFLSLKVNVPNTMENKICRLYAAGVIMMLIKRNESLVAIFQNNKNNKKLFYDLLYQSLKLLNVTNTVRYSNEGVNYAYGVYIFSSMLKHSCISNVDIVTASGFRQVTYVCQKIKRGQDIVISKIGSQTLKFMARVMRTTTLHKIGITCNCVMCDERSPDMFTRDPSLPEPQIIPCGSLTPGSILEHNKNVIRKMTSYINTYDSRETIFTLQMCRARNNLHYGFSFLYREQERELRELQRNEN